MRYGPLMKRALVAYISLQLGVKGDTDPSRGGTQPTSLENNEFKEEKQSSDRPMIGFRGAPTSNHIPQFRLQLQDLRVVLLKAAHSQMHAGGMFTSFPAKAPNFERVGIKLEAFSVGRSAAARSGSSLSDPIVPAAMWE